MSRCSALTTTRQDTTTTHHVLKFHPKDVTVRPAARHYRCLSCCSCPLSVTLASVSLASASRELMETADSSKQHER